MEHIIRISVRDKIAQWICGPAYVCGNSDYIVNFDFDAEWDEYPTKTARFEPDKGSPVDVVFEGTKCMMPALRNTHIVRIGVYAGDIRATTVAYVPAKQSILCDSGSPSEPAPDVYAQIMELLNKQGGGGSASDAVTPQQFGAVADGAADDTAAVQKALDAGGAIYFPPGRYRVTSQLTAVKPCKIMMCRPYPIAHGADYPLTSDDNGMGARIETSAPGEYGLLIGDGVQVDGLYLRAMAGFSGVLFKCDGHLGCQTYPSQIRLRHMQLDCAYYDVNPVSMFDFVPNASYFAILDDITIGSLRGRQICGYGFRSILDGEAGWGNSMRINNLCIDLLADYPLYLDGNGLGMENWVFENLSIQAYPYLPDDPGYMGKQGHADIITLKNLQRPVFVGAKIWDLDAASVLGDIIRVENTDEIVCVGCEKEFDSVETVMNAKLQNAAESLSIKGLQMRVGSVAETGANRLTLSDGSTERAVDIPATAASDEQIANGVTQWFDANARPDVQVGRNKYNPMDIDTLNGLYGTDGTFTYTVDATTTHFIRAASGASVQASKNGKDVALYNIVCFDEEKNFLGIMSRFANADAQTITVANTAYIRATYLQAIAAYVDRANAKIMITVNDPIQTTVNNRIYEPYKVTYVGGLGDIVVLSSPDGTQYRLSVTNDGAVQATPVNSGEEPEEEIIKDVVWNMSGRTALNGGWYPPDTARTIDYSTYVEGVARTGRWNGNTGTTAVVDGEDFTVTTGQSGMGIGVPLELSPMHTYIISLDIDAKASANIVYHDEYGVFKDSEVLLADNSAAGSYARKFIVKPYKYLVLHFAATTEGPARFSNVKVAYVEE